MIALLLFSCVSESAKEETPLLADVFVEKLGDPVPFLQGDLRERFFKGQKVMSRSFRTDDGLGPFFNADSCAGCHQGPVAGGSGPRYRDFWLIKSQRWDGALVNEGTNGASPVRNMYTTPPIFHSAVSEDVSLYARRNTPPGFGVGLFAFVDEEAIFASADPEDSNGDGISGRVNFEQGLLGRFGYKAQAATLESFNRGAIFNQMGITTDPLFYEFPEEHALYLPNNDSWFVSSAFAQVSAPDEPTIDTDGIADPELSNDDQLNLLIFSTYLGILPFEENSNGSDLFHDIGCTGCHSPKIPSSIGPLPTYSDLLLHDMGEDLADGIAVGFASGSEFRTQPLWGVALHGPYLHDGRADTLSDAIEWHGGEALASRDAWLALSSSEKNEILAFLKGLGGESRGGVLTEEPNVLPLEGTAGGPMEGLSSEELDDFTYGQYLFDASVVEPEGLGIYFNADSCRACHQDPVLGGSGGIDVNVLRYGYRNEEGVFQVLSENVLKRSVLWHELPQELHAQANVIEARNPPSVLGLGLVEQIPDTDILAFADPEDADGDGISGRPHILPDGRLGRFGWKSDIPTLSDVLADAMLNELGMTVHPSLSGFTIADDFDTCADPELDSNSFSALLFYLRNLSPSPIVSEQYTVEGEALFVETGCASCHRLELAGYSDYLLHDVAPDPFVLVEQTPGVDASEFRTAPLWGIRDTAPYLHDGSAPNITKAIEQGHFGEATQSRLNFQALSAEEKEILLGFLESL